MNQIYSEEKKDKENTPKTPSKENAWVKTKDPQYKYKKTFKFPNSSTYRKTHPATVQIQRLQ